MTADQVPSIGRIVHYVSHGTPVQQDGTRVHQSVCRAAVVTDVPWGAAETGRVGLCVLNPSGMFFNDSTYSALNGSPAVPGSWHWPERV